MKQDYIKIWDKMASKFAKGKVSKTHPQQERLLLEELEKDSSVLDVGCANGKHVFFLAKYGFRATGLDLSKEMIRIAVERAKKEELKVNFVVGDATKLNFPDQSFDYVICMGNVLGSIPGVKQREKALNEIFRVARNEIILELVKSDTTKETKSRYKFLNKDESYFVKRWDEKEISAIIKRLGYDARIKKGRKSVIAKYFFYVIVNLNKEPL